MIALSRLICKYRGMRIWETFRVFLGLVAVWTAIGVIGWQFWLDHAGPPPIRPAPSLNEVPPPPPPPTAKFDPALADIPAPHPDSLAFAARLRAGDWEALENVDRSVLPLFQDSSPDLADALDLWVEARPESAKARMARGAYWRNVGWSERGGRYAFSQGSKGRRAARETFGKAVADLKAAAELAPDWAAPQAYIVNLEMARGEFHQMHAAFLAGVEADPAERLSYRYRLHAAQPWWSSGNAERARATVREILESLGPKEGRPAPLRDLDGYGPLLDFRILNQQGEDEAAEGFMISAREHGPFFAWAYGHFLTRKYRIEEAAQQLRAHLIYDPNNVDALGLYANAMRRLGRRDATRAALGRALALDPYCAYCNRQAGMLARDEERYQDAQEDLKRALVYGERDDATWSLLGYLSLNQFKDPARAVGYFKRAVDLAPKSTRYRYAYAQALGDTLDCRVVPEYRTYLKLCDAGADCDPAQKEWAEFAWRDLVYRDLCTRGGAQVQQ